MCSAAKVVIIVIEGCATGVTADRNAGPSTAARRALAWRIRVSEVLREDMSILFAASAAFVTSCPVPSSTTGLGISVGFRLVSIEVSGMAGYGMTVIVFIQVTRSTTSSSRVAAAECAMVTVSVLVGLMVMVVEMTILDVLVSVTDKVIVTGITTRRTFSVNVKVLVVVLCISSADLASGW